MKVQFHDIAKSYDGFVAVHRLNLAIESGGLHFLLGPSGCGKTTTLRMLAGLEKPSSGRLMFGDRDVTRESAAERGISMVFQNYALWPHMNVRKNIEYGLKLKKIGTREVKRRADEALAMTQLTRFEHRLPGQLSGGQQQRVALARALAVQPNVLLLDEPLSNLDAKLRTEMRDNILNIHRETGVTMVYVTHDQKEALSMASHISIMHAGHLMQSDSPSRVYHHPASAFVAGFIGETNLLPGKLLSKDGDLCRVETSIGILNSSRKDCPFQIGEDISISIRPEAFRFCEGLSTPAAESRSLNRIDTVLKHVTYLGDSEQLRASVGKCDLKINIYNIGERNLKPGDRLSFDVPDRDVVLVPKADDSLLGT